MRNSRNRWCVFACALMLLPAGLHAQMKGKDSASTRKVVVERISVISSKSFDEVVAGIERGVAHPDMPALLRKIAASKNEAELEEAERAITACTTRIVPGAKLSVIREDEPDNRILECAEAAGSQFIISGDRHLLRLREHGGARILRAAEFLDLAAE